MWGAQQRRLRGQPLGEEDEEEEEEEENNNSSSHQEEEEAEERTEGGEEQGREEEEREEGEEEEEDEDEEEMDQDSDDFEHSVESGREEEEDEEGEGEEGLRSPSLRNNVSVPNNNLDSGCTHQSSSNNKVSCHWNVCCKLWGLWSSRDIVSVAVKVCWSHFAMLWAPQTKFLSTPFVLVWKQKSERRDVTKLGETKPKPFAQLDPTTHKCAQNKLLTVLC